MKEQDVEKLELLEALQSGVKNLLLNNDLTDEEKYQILEEVHTILIADTIDKEIEEG